MTSLGSNRTTSSASLGEVVSLLRHPRAWISLVIGALMASSIFTAAVSIAASDLNPAGPGDDLIDLDQFIPPPLIELDAVSSDVINSGGSSHTYSHTVGDFANRMLVVGVQAQDANLAQCNVSGITYAGVAMTEASPRATAGVAGPAASFICVEMYYLGAPATGTNDVVVTWQGRVNRRAGGAISLYNVAQQAPTVTGTASSNAATSISVDVTPLVEASWIVDSVGTGDPNVLTAGTGEIQRYQVNGAAHGGAGVAQLQAIAELTTISWSQTASEKLAQIVAVYEQAP